MKHRLHSDFQVTHNTNHPGDVVDQQPCNRRAHFFAVSVLVIGLTAQLIARPVWADFADSAPAPVSSFHPQVSYNDPQNKPFEITGIDPGKIVRDQNGPSTRVLRVMFDTLLPNRKMVAMVEYFAGNTLTKRIPNISCGIYPQPMSFQSCEIKLNRAHSKDTHITVSMGSENTSRVATEAHFDMPIISGTGPIPQWPVIRPSAPGVEREHGSREETDSLILLDVQPRILQNSGPWGTRTVKVTFWTRFPDAQVYAYPGIVTNVTINGRVQSSRADYPHVGGNCDAHFSKAGVHSCDLTIDMARAATSDEPIFVWVTDQNELTRYYTRLQVVTGAPKQVVKLPSENMRRSYTPGSGNQAIPGGPAQTKFKVPSTAEEVTRAPVATPGIARLPKAAVLETPAIHKIVRPVELTYSGMEINTNRFGGDYTSRDLGTAEQCQAACKGEAQCKSWSWVKPGVQGPQAKCWLKNSVPAASRNECCVSGVK